MSELNKRWLVIGWYDSQPIIRLNGEVRGYHSLKEAVRFKFRFGPHHYVRDSESPTGARQYVPNVELNTNRVVELTFHDESVEARYVD